MRATTQNSSAHFLLSLLLATLAGCAFDGALREDFYRPSAGSPKLPLYVALIDNEALRPKPVLQWGLDDFHVAIAPGFTHAVKAEMAALFERVKPVRDFEQAAGEDLIVQIESHFMRDAKDHGRIHLLGAKLRPVGWKEDLAHYESSVPNQSACDGMCAAAPVLTGLSLLTLTPIVLPWGGASATGQAEENLGQATTTMLHDLSAKIRNDARVQAFVEQKKTLQAAVAAGEQGEQSGDRLKALEQYARAWQARPNLETERRLREKVEKLAAGLSALPPVPEEARRYYARASTYMKTASTEGYVKVLDEMRQAVTAAPLWAEAYYNLGLIQESAGQYSDAIRSLKLYLILAPKSSDAQAVQARIYELEVAVEKSMKQSG